MLNTKFCSRFADTLHAMTPCTMITTTTSTVVVIPATAFVKVLISRVWHPHRQHAPRRAIYTASRHGRDGSWITAGRRARPAGAKNTFAGGCVSRMMAVAGERNGPTSSANKPRLSNSGDTRSRKDSGKTPTTAASVNESENDGNAKRRMSSDIVSSQKDYLRRIKEAGLRGQWREVHNLLGKMRAEGVPRNVFVYNSAISALARCRRPEDAEALLNDMLNKDDLAPDKISYNSAINAHARCGDLEAGWRLLQRMRNFGLRPDVITFNTVADAAAKKGDAVAAAEVLALMAEQGVVPDVITYNACLAACRAKGDLRRATALLELMREDGVSPDQRSYSAVISAAGRDGNWAEALNLMQEMRNEGLKPDRVTFNTAISAVGAAGEWQTATSLLAEMNAAGVAPDTVSYTAALTACGQAGEWELALELLNDMRAAGVNPNAFTYSAAMDACGKAGQQKEALRLLSDMRRANIPPDTVAYNSAIDACSVAGDWSAALQLLDAMKRGIDGAARPDVVSYGGAIAACARAGRADEALQLVAELRANEARVTEADARAGGSRAGVPGRGVGSRVGVAHLPLPNLVTYSAALFACLKAGKVERGGEVLNEMIAAGIQPNDIHCDTMVAAWAAAGEPERAVSVMKRLRTYGFEPSIGTYEALVWGFAQVADWESTVRLLGSILGRGLQPTTRSWDAAIAACSQAGHWERALGLLADMRRQGVYPSRVTYTAAVAGLNRPRYAEWGPKLERLAQLLQNRADARYEDERLRRTWNEGGDGGSGESGVGGRGNYDGNGRSRYTSRTTKGGIRQRQRDKQERCWDNRGNGQHETGSMKAPAIAPAMGSIEGAGQEEETGANGSENMWSVRGSAGGGSLGEDGHRSDRNGPSSEDFDGSIEALGDAGEGNGAACLLRVMRQEGFHASPRAYRSVIYACARVGLLMEAATLARELDMERGGRQSPLSPSAPQQSQPKATITLDAVVDSPVQISKERIGGADSISEERGRGGATDHVREDFVGGPDAAEANLKTSVEQEEDEDEFDLAVMYNCIVRIFARAATRGMRSQKKQQQGATRSPTMEAVAAPSATATTTTETAPTAVEKHRASDGKDSAGDGLVSMLLGITDGAGGGLADEAASGGVELIETAPSAASVIGATAAAAAAAATTAARVELELGEDKGEN